MRKRRKSPVARVVRTTATTAPRVHNVAAMRTKRIVGLLLMVAPLDHEFMRWIYELRLGIEPMAASLAAKSTAPAVKRLMPSPLPTAS